MKPMMIAPAASLPGNGKAVSVPKGELTFGERIQPSGMTESAFAFERNLPEDFARSLEADASDASSPPKAEETNSEKSRFPDSVPESEITLDVAAPSRLGEAMPHQPGSEPSRAVVSVGGGAGRDMLETAETHVMKPRSDKVMSANLPTNELVRHARELGPQDRLANADAGLRSGLGLVVDDSQGKGHVPSVSLEKSASQQPARTSAEAFGVSERLAMTQEHELPMNRPQGDVKLGQTQKQATQESLPGDIQRQRSILAAQTAETVTRPAVEVALRNSDRAPGTPDRITSLDVILSSGGGPDTAIRPGAQAQQAYSALPEPKAVALVREALVEMSAKAQREIEIHLSPRELGKLRFVMVPSEGQITVQITADRPEILDALRRHAESFAQDLGSEGFGHAEFEFLHEDAEESSFDDTARPEIHGTDMDGPDLQEQRWQITPGRLDVRL